MQQYNIDKPGAAVVKGEETRILGIEGMTCDNCVKTLTRALQTRKRDQGRSCGSRERTRYDHVRHDESGHGRDPQNGREKRVHPDSGGEK